MGARGASIVRVVTVALLARAAGAATIAVVDSNGDDMWSTAGSYSTIAASVGDVLRFKYSTSHDVYKMADYTAYDECLSAYSTELGTNSVGGGSGSLSNQYDYTVTAEDLAAGTIYFACSYYPWYSFDHCVEGQKFAVTVTAGATTTPAPTPATSISAGARAAAPRAALVAGAAGLVVPWLWAACV